MTWEYIAGFFDGEGTVARHGHGHRIHIPQTSLPVLRDIRSFSSIGNICEVTKRKAHWKDSWIYFITKQEDVYTFLKGVSPFLIVKKAQALEAIPRLEEVLRLQRNKKNALEQRRLKALQLRKQGLSYWRIGLTMNLDRGYVRRLILRRWHG